MQTSIYKNLALVVVSLSLFFVTLVMVVSILKNNSNASKLVNIDTLEGRYYEIDPSPEELSELKIIMKKPETPKALKPLAVQAVYIGVINNFDQFKVVNCNGVDNCNNTMIMRINRTNKPYNLNSNYALKAEISKDKKINILEVNEL
jgi:hypothetical protein